ncbi:ricin-type beta-trefoil lectin domain protein [Actinoplanes sp. CA-142083]|uniref:ricin-type beta-trefoil lectin domain protein n=1 Tax=Actinoplanes sp. CA-142083 TaxID=3239903 RepID=UPI003D8F1BC7
MKAARLLAALAAIPVILVAPASAAHADTGDTWVYPNRLDDGQTASRLDRCRLGFVLQAGGPEIKKVAQPALAGTDAQMHTAADPQYWNTTALSVAYDKDQASRSAMWDTLYDRKDVWSDSIPNNFTIPTETVTGFQWAPNFYGDLGITGFYVDQFFKGEDKLYEDLAPIASDEAVTKGNQLADQQHLYNGDDDAPHSVQEEISWGEVGDQDVFGDGTIFDGNHHADDLREFLQFGGFPKTALTPGTAEYRFEVEALKQRFSSCDAENPLDPNHVLANVVKDAAAEWRTELDSQSAQRSAIVNAQVKAYSDLETSAIAMGEAVGQSWIAGQLTKWQSCYTAGGYCWAGSGPITFKYKSATTLCLDNTGSSTANNNKIELYACNNSTAQKFRPGVMANYLDGTLINTGTNRCLDLNGTNVVLNACTSGKASQHWQWQSTVGNTRLYNVGANKCLNFATATSGLQATVQACSGGTTQQFVSSQDNSNTGTGHDTMFWPTTADFTYATNEIKNAQTRAAAQLTIANNASADAQTQATAVTNAQNAATTIATNNNYPVGRGLAYAQQSAQVTKASAAGAAAAAKATATAVQATKAAVADSATLISLAQTQAKAMQAEYAKNAAQEAARQAKAAANSAAREAAAAAADAATAKAKRQVAEQAKATAQVAANKAAQQRQIAEQQRQVAAQQRAIAEQKHAEASAANADAQRQQGIAASARAQAEADAQTAADRDFDAQSSANQARIYRETAENAARQRDALASRAAAMQSRANADEGSTEAAASRAAANDAQAAADRADTAADRAQHDADVATAAAQAAREAATRAHAAAARSLAAANEADKQVAITRSAMMTAHSAAADALAAAKDAKQHADNADADAAAAAADMQEAARQAGEAKAAADAAVAQSAITAGRAYATAQAAVAARDSAAEVAAPANEAVGLGAPFVDKDSAAALAVLVGQGALTVAQQQTAAAQARADEANAAAANAAALAAAATGDAKIAAQAAADAATSAAAAAKSARDARASAAAAASDAAAAAQAAAATSTLNAQAERDAAAAHAAATAAAGDANAADAAADAAERDAASARSAAAQARVDADAAQKAADEADKYADDAEAAAARAQADAAAAEKAASDAEKAAQDQEDQRQLIASYDGGFMFLEIAPVGDINVTTGDLVCNAKPTCDVDVPVHMTGTLVYNVVVCQYQGTTSAICERLELGTKPFAVDRTKRVHLDVREVMQASLRNLVDLAVGDFIGCGKYIWQQHGVNGDCAWAAANFIPYEKLFAWAKAVVGLKNAARTGEGLAEAFDDLHRVDVDLNTAIKLETEINEDITRACLTQSFDAATPVLMADGGRRPIAEVAVGDRVAGGVVSKTYRTYDTDLVDVVVSGGAVIHTTSKHPFWSGSDDRWIDAASLVPGTALRGDDGSPVTVADVRVIPGGDYMYDLTVEGAHTFYVFAGDESVLVHNVSCKAIPLGNGLYQYPDGSIRDAAGKFVSSSGTARVGAAAEKAVMDDLAAQGYNVIRTQVAVRGNGDQLRYYDCAIDLGGGNIIGVEVKSGSATRTAAQRDFDNWILAGNHPDTVGRYAGQYKVVDVREIKVP